MGSKLRADASVAYPNQARARAAMPGRMSSSAMEEKPTSTTLSGRWAGFAQYFVVGYTATSAAAAPAETPEPDSFGVVVAESWKDIYPNEYQTYLANESNTPQGKEDYLAEYPELVTMYGGAQSSMAKQGYTCADCHMAPAKAEDGTEYHSHNLVNPTEDPAIMENSEGAHNPSLAQENLDKCEDELKAGYTLLNMTY